MLATHAVDFLHLADKILVLKQGQVQAYGPFSELQDDPTLQEVLSIYKKQSKENQDLKDQQMLQPPEEPVEPKEVMVEEVDTSAQGHSSSNLLNMGI